MLKLNISKAISMRPRKGPRNRGTKKGISSKGGRGKSECRGSGRSPRADGISGPEGLPGTSCSLGPRPSFPRSRILCSICCRFMTGRLGDTISVCLQVVGEEIHFVCSNSNYYRSEDQHHGIGLDNIRKRLRLLFGERYKLSIDDTADCFDVQLLVPVS